MATQLILSAGYYIAGHNLGESRQQRQAALASLRGALPSAKLHCVSGVGGPADILDCIASGFDVLESRCAAALY